VNFKNTIIIMTSNLGSHLIMDMLQNMTDENRDEVLYELREKLYEMLRAKIKPEILNRIDEVIMFKPLSTNELRKIVDIQLEKIIDMLQKNNDITLNIDSDAKDWLAKLGYDITFGVRPLKRTIQNHITNQLAEKILSGDILPGDKVNITVTESGKFEFKKK
jgi:ATP-dependent Clp protease ATP-binding subunit ClpB